MFRFVNTVCLLLLVMSSVGCQICRSPYDYLVSAYIERHNDYRGSDPMYRAGFLSSSKEGDYREAFVDYYANFGNYGVTTPISIPSQILGSQPNIGLPDHSPWDSPSGTNIPPIDELLRFRDSGTAPLSPSPLQQPQTFPPFKSMSPDTIPFTPSDVQPFSPGDAVPHGTLPGDERLVPPTFPTLMETAPPITLDELRRLDPTIQNVEIISIEDVTPRTRTR